MGGAFHFFSLDLAKYVVKVKQTPPHKYQNPILNQQLPFVPHEDVTTGNLVFSHPKLYKYMIKPSDTSNLNATTTTTAAATIDDENDDSNPIVDVSNANKLQDKYKEIVLLTNPNAYLEMWRHPVKDPTRYYNLWRKFLSSRKKRRKQKKQKHSFGAR